MFVMVRVDATGYSGTAFAHQLLKEQGVSVLPGEAFGHCARDYVRLSLAQPINVLKPALDRVEQFCHELQLDPEQHAGRQG